MSNRKQPSGLDALKAIRGHVPNSVLKTVIGRPGPATGAAPAKTSRSPASTEPAPPAEPDDGELFRRQVGRIQPLKTAAHAEIARPKPAPAPRPRQLGPEPEAPRRAPRIDENDPVALFRASLGDVAPIRDFNRVDLSAQRQQVQRGQAIGQLQLQTAKFHAHTEALLVRLPFLHDVGTELRGQLVHPQVRAMSHVEPAPLAIDERLLHDPQALFRHAAGQVAPLKNKNLASVDRPLPAPLPIKREQDERNVLREALESPISFEDRLDMGDEAAYLRVGLPRRVLTDLRRGRWVVQGELDLHGLTRDEARASLSRFIAAALQQGRRCLRIIHGKGHGSPGRVPVLKHLSRGWLAQREDILAFCQARPHDGGDGALLVLLQAGSAGNG